MTAARHVKAVVQYDGTDFAGFQVQPDRPTIQGELERAFSILAAHPVRVRGAGRTDAGVHARGQVVAFSLKGTIPTESLPEAANSLLPASIVVWDVEEVGPDFHPCHGAISKVYTYWVWRDKRLSPFFRHYAYHYPLPLSMAAILEGAAILKGRHDFKAFRASGSSVRGSVRTIHRLEVLEEGEFLKFVFEADGFLYNMVRIIVGTLLEVGRGRLSPEDVCNALEEGRRGMLGPTVPPQGLCLEQVKYS